MTKRRVVLRGMTAALALAFMPADGLAQAPPQPTPSPTPTTSRRTDPDQYGSNRSRRSGREDSGAATGQSAPKPTPTPAAAPGGAPAQQPGGTDAQTTGPGGAKKVRPAGPPQAGAPATKGQVKEVSRAMIDASRTRKVEYDEAEWAAQPGVVILNSRKLGQGESALQRQQSATQETSNP